VLSNDSEVFHMVHTSNKTTRSLAVLALPKRVGAIIAYATGVVQGMTGNPAFPTPVVPLAMVAAAIDDLRNAEAEAMTRTKGAVATRNASRGALVAMLHLLRIYVQSVADRNGDHGSAIIQSAGMAVKKITPRPPRVFAAFAGAVPGTVKIVAPSAGHRASYDWQYATDGATWVGLGTTLQASTTMTDQSAGTVLHLRYRAVTRKGQAAWSASITFTVSSS
jgi:hypothetical protein